MEDSILTHVVWALTLGAVSAVSLPLGSLVGLNVRFSQRYIAIFAAFGAGALIAALDRVRAVVPTRFPKPILTGVRLEASDGWLHLAATDGEIKLFTQIEAEGHLPPCVVSCAELVRRVKVSKGDACTLAVRARPPRLVVNGGRVEHTLPLMPEEDFPPIPDRHEGDEIAVDAEEFRTALAVTSHAVAREPSRYAINGVLLESDTDGVRLVASRSPTPVPGAPPLPWKWGEIDPL